MRYALVNYVAIDFETASTEKDSACSVGLVRMDEDGNAVSRYYSLIRPRVPKFDPFCFQIHHLDPLDVLSAPTIADIWEDMKAFIGPLPLVAHNAQFDISVLRGSLESWGIEPVHNDYYCTLSLARKLWKGRPSYNLTSLASAFGWEYEAHNALADSEICGRLFSMLCKGHIYTDEDARRFFHMVYKSRKSAFPRTI